MEPLPTWAWLAAGAAGALGVWLRMGLLAAFSARSLGSSEVALAVVNLLGCLAIGVVATRLSAGPLRVVLVMGLLGALTTYSSFAWMLVELARRADWTGLTLQLVVHVLGGVLAVVAGVALAGGWGSGPAVGDG
jgi:CrcB protein